MLEMFTDEEKEYVLLAYYLGRKKLLNCIALQQLTKDILDVFRFESPIATSNSQNINTAAGCCLCKEKETIFKDFLEYYLLKDNATGCEEVHEKDVENVWSDISRLWKNLHKYDGHMSGRQLIKNYEKAGEALMRTHNVKIYDYMKKKYGDLENLENWSRIIYKVQVSLQSLGETLGNMCGSETPVQSVHKVPNSGESVRVAPITLNVQGNAHILAKHAMQCRTYGIDAAAESHTSVRMKYMVCLRCSMENDYSQPISLMGLHSKYFNISQQMFLVFEKRMHQNGHSIELEKYTPTQFSTTSRNDESASPSVIEQKTLPTKSSGEDVVDVIQTLQAVPYSNPTYPMKMVAECVAPPTSTLPTIDQPSKEDHEHTLDRSSNKKVHRTRKGKRKNDWIGRVVNWPVKYMDDQPKHETLTEALGQLEKLFAKFARIEDLKQVPSLQRHMPLPDMPIMSKFKVHRPADGEPWPICHGFPEDNIEPTVPPPTNIPAFIKTSRCDLRISMHKLFDDQDYTLFPELDLNDCDKPAFGLDKSKLNPLQDVPILTPFCLSGDGSSKRFYDKRQNTPVVQLTHSHKSLSATEVKCVETDILQSDRNLNVNAIPDALIVSPRKTVGPPDQSVGKIDNEVGDLEPCNTASSTDPTMSCNNADDDNDDRNFRESQNSNEDAIDVVEDDDADSGSKSEFSIYVAEYLARFMPDLDESLKSFLARRQRLVKGKTEPAKLHFSHYLCSLDGTKTNESLSNDFTCSKLVQVGDPTKTSAHKYKNCEWVPKSLSRLTRLVLHEHILLHKQAVIDRRAVAKSVAKKTKSAKSQKWRNRFMKNKNEAVAGTSLSTCRPQRDDNADSVHENIVSNVVTQCLGRVTTTSEQYSNNGTANGEMLKPPRQEMNNSLVPTSHENLESGIEVDQTLPPRDVDKSDNHDSVNRIRSDDEHSEWKVSKPHTTMPGNSSDALLRMRYKRDSDGNWKHVDYKKNAPFRMQARPLFRNPMFRTTSMSEFHHKLSTISHHRPPKISKLSTRNQSIVQNFFNYFKKSKEKRKRSMANMNKSLLFSSSYLPSFEEIGFTAINPSPHVFATTPKLQQISSFKRQKSLPDIGRLITKPCDPVAGIPLPNLPSEILQQPSKHDRNLEGISNRGGVTISSLSPTTISDFHEKCSGEVLTSNGNVKTMRVDNLHSSDASISANIAEFAVTALQMSHLSAPTDDDTFTSTYPDVDSYCLENRLNSQNLTSQRQRRESKPITTASTSEVFMNKKLQDCDNKDSCLSEKTIDPRSFIRTPLSQGEQTGQSMKVLAKSVMTASTNLDCSFATTEYKYHLSYESILTILDSIAQKCKPGNFDHDVPGLPKPMNYVDEKLWKSNDRLSLALKYCFANRSRTPAYKRCSNKRIGKSLVSFNKFWDRMGGQRLSKKKSLKLKDESKVTYHPYWWSIPSHDLSKNKQVNTFAPAKSEPVEEGSFRRKFERDITSNSNNSKSKMVLRVFNDAVSDDKEFDLTGGFTYTRTRSRLKSLTKSDIGNAYKTLNDSNYSDLSSSDAKTDSDDAGCGQPTSISYHGSIKQPKMQQRINKRKRKFDATDSLSSHKRMRALMTADETNMKRYAQIGKTEQNARCLQPLFESSLNIRSVNRVLYDSANAKSFSLVPPEFMQNTPTVFELGNQSLSLLQVSKDACVLMDPKNGDKIQNETFSQSSHESLQPCSSATDKPGETISNPQTRYRLPCLLRFKSKPCSPKGLGKAKKRRVLWSFNRRGHRPKNVGIRTPSQGRRARQPSWNIDEISFELFGKIPVVIIPKVKI